ncbi:GtrA family protein [Pararhizobium haloflavum]|uniref:GtrA family protein n=1 Tax=Pararhizobium haloflavum TaxID=2037914 RepID=UPI000C1A84A8|nr:GtrA family protein [Pararhizobium haloflavum]
MSTTDRLFAFLRQISTFAGVGVAATLVHYLTALALSLMMPIAYANPFGFGAAFFVSYFGHLHLTFRLDPSERRHAQRLPRFFLTAFSGFLIGQAILVALTSIDVLPGPAALAIAVFTVPVITFVASRLWVFRVKPQHDATRG